jgi:uncharacterized protein
MPRDSQSSPAFHALVHIPSGVNLASVEKLDGFWAKGIGAIARKEIPEGKGLWLPDVASIHTMFVRFPLDILFLDANLTLLRACPNVRPWSPLIRCRHARHTIELRCGALTDDALLAVGDPWSLTPSADDDEPATRLTE